MAQYEVVCEQDENGWWVGTVRGVPGVHTQGRSLATIRKRIREALATAVDDAKKAEIHLSVKTPPDVKEQMAVLRDLKMNAETAQRAMRMLEKVVVHELTSSMSYRDAGEVLEVSAQRIQELMK